MKLILAVAALVVALALPVGASAAPWKPGTKMYVTEKRAVEVLETEFDWAYCDGIPRFGHRGEFPYEKYVVFDCSIKMDGTLCTDARMKAVKHRKRGLFSLRLIRECH